MASALGALEAMVLMSSWPVPARLSDVHLQVPTCGARLQTHDVSLPGIAKLAKTTFGKWFLVALARTMYAYAVGSQRGFVAPRVESAR